MSSVRFPNRVKRRGWRPDIPSFKDWPMDQRLEQLQTPEGATRYERNAVSMDRRTMGVNPPVRDQGNLGSCVGMSLTYAVGYLRRSDRDELSTIYSALQAYFDARIRDGSQWKDVDAGAYIRDGLDALREVGVAPESRWPYRVTKFSNTPPKSVYKEAARWKLGAHYRCETLDDILTAIDKGFAVVGGIACFSSMFTAQVDDTGVIPMPSRSDDFLGGHAMYFDMFDDRTRLIRCQNSWGELWGDEGYGFLPYDYAADRSLSDDWWAMEAESPATTPWKD